MKKNKILNWIIAILSLLLVGLVTGIGVYFGTNHFENLKQNSNADTTAKEVETIYTDGSVFDAIDTNQITSNIPANVTIVVDDEVKGKVVGKLGTVNSGPCNLDNFGYKAIENKVELSITSSSFNGVKFPEPFSNSNPQSLKFNYNGYLVSFKTYTYDKYFSVTIEEGTPSTLEGVKVADSFDITLVYKTVTESKAA